MAHYWVSEFHRFEEPKVTTTTTAKTQYQDVTDHTLIETNVIGRHITTIEWNVKEISNNNNNVLQNNPFQRYTSRSFMYIRNQEADDLQTMNLTEDCVDAKSEGS